MTQRLQAALKRARHLQGQYVVAGSGGTWATLELMRWNLPRLCRKAGIQELGWHALRHTFCSHLAMKGAPARTIMELAGHADLATTLRYMHLSPGATDAAIALLDQPLHEHRTATP
jgi:site-specific recombinase XerD